MRCPLLPLLLLPALVSAQQQSGGTTSNVQLSTSLTVEVTLGPDRAESSVTRTQVFTITPAASSAQPTGANTPASSGARPSSANGNNSGSAATTTTVPRNLPTASVDAGQTHSAPIPGAKAGGGIYGPDDNYIAGAVALTRSAALLGLGGFVAGGLVMML